MAEQPISMNPSSSPDYPMGDLESAKKMCGALGVLLNYLAADECDDKVMDTAQRVHEDLAHYIHNVQEAFEKVLAAKAEERVT